MNTTHATAKPKSKPKPNSTPKSNSKRPNPHAPSTHTPTNWPPHLPYLITPSHSPHLTPSQLTALRTPPPTPAPTIPLPSRPSPSIAITAITDPSHPAHGQHGIFATRTLPPDSLVCIYLGVVHGDGAHDTDASSDYDVRLVSADADGGGGVSVDAARAGNEARFVNDYRGVARTGPNAEFRDVWMVGARGMGERGLGVFVLSGGKEGRRRRGIRRDQEVLVSYGRGFWRERREEGLEERHGDEDGDGKG